MAWVHTHIWLYDIFKKKKKMEEQIKNYRESGLFGQMAREGNIQEEPEISHGTRKQRSY